jgi:hypothetical protein
LIYTKKYIKTWKHCSGRVFLPLRCSCEGSCVIFREGVTCTHCCGTNELVNINILILIPFHFIISKMSESKLCSVILTVSVWTDVTQGCPFFWETMPHRGWLMLNVSGLRDGPLCQGMYVWWMDSNQNLKLGPIYYPERSATNFPVTWCNIPG